MTETGEIWAREAAEWASEFIPSMIGAILLLIIGWIVAGWAKRIVYGRLEKVRRLDDTVKHFFANTVRYLILIMVLVAVLAQFGVQTASIIAALGAAGLAIGLALQGTLQNVAAGIMLIFLRPFNSGDFIETSSFSGTIVEVGLFATELKRLDGVYLFVPNSELWNSAITNYSRHTTRRCDITVGIGYDDSIEKAQEIMQDLASKEQRVLDEPAAQTFVADLADSSVNITLRYWAPTSEWWPTSRDLTAAIKKAFDEAGISIPFPQLDVHRIAQETKSD